jgi:chromosome segregation ATPase
MTKLVSLLGRKSAPAAEGPTGEMPRRAEQKPDIELDHELFLPIAAQLGHENEAVRNLLIDAEHKLSELETIKSSIGRLVEPVSKTLRAYEDVKNEKLSLQGVLNNTRIAHDKLRDDHDSAQKRATALEAEAARLRQVVGVAQQSVAALEKTKTEQVAELAARQTQIVELQRHVQQQGAELQRARGDNQRLADGIAAADKRTVQLEAQAQAAAQQTMQSAQERAAVQAALDKAHAGLAQTSRRLTETEKTLTATQTRLKTVEANLAETQADRSRLSLELDDAHHKYRSEITVQQAQFDALQARSNMTERLLEEARATMVARADEIRTFERRMDDSTSAHSNASDQLAMLTEALAERDAMIKELQQGHDAINEHNLRLANHIAGHETAHDGAQHKIREQADLLRLLESEIAAIRSAHAMQIEQFNAQIQREKLERSMAEGALEAGRKDIARLLREIAALQHRPNPLADIEAPSADDRLRSAA